jgi:hypothetical protein
MSDQPTQYYVMTEEQCRERALKSLEPGYFVWDGIPAIRRNHSDYPEIWHSGKWHYVPDLGKFEHEAVRISEEEFLPILEHHGGSL